MWYYSLRHVQASTCLKIMKTAAVSSRQLYTRFDVLQLLTFNFKIQCIIRGLINISKVIAPFGWWYLSSRFFPSWQFTAPQERWHINTRAATQSFICSGRQGFLLL